MLKVGDKVQFIDGQMTRFLPNFYPAVFTKGRVLEVEPEYEHFRYHVKWENNRTVDWWYSDKQLRKIY